MNSTLSLITLALVAAPTALAQEAPPPPREPPPEAVSACTGLAAGDACSFTSPFGLEEGACWAPEERLPLACVPEDHPLPPR